MTNILDEYIVSSSYRNNKIAYRLLYDSEGLWIQNNIDYDNELFGWYGCKLGSTLQSVDNINRLITMLEKAKKFIQAEEKL